MNVNGVLLLYHHPLRINAPTIMEHVNIFKQHSRFQVWKVNTELGFPEGLGKLQFRLILLHYSLFGTGRYYLGSKFLSYIEQSQVSYKIAFFQDEYRYCQPRFSFLNRYEIDCVYTLVEPAYFKDVYQKYTNVPKLVYNLTGYVSDDLVTLAQELTKPDEERQIDVGYRGRRLPFYMGKGAQEKHEIAVKFREQAAGLGLKLDLETDEHKRIYGEAWYEFLANCRAVLGVEAGVSIFDIEDVVRVTCERLLASQPKITFEEVSEQVLQAWEGNIFHRTISPRHFEAAAFRICQILFEGKYSGVLEPMVHYIPLKKDFSNFDHVIRMFKDKQLRRELTENAYRDLIASGRYSYRRFIEDFDQELLAAGFQPDMAIEDIEQVTILLEQGRDYREFRGNIKAAVYYPLVGNKLVRFFVKPVLQLYRRLK